MGMMHLLRAADGRFVSSVACTGGLRLVDRCGDDAVWVLEGNGGESEHEIFHSAADGTPVTVCECSAELRQAVQVLAAPQKLPSMYLQELQEQGYVLIDNVLTSEESATVRQTVFDEMEAQAKSEGARGAGAWDFVRTCPQILRFHTHPVMLWVIGKYLGTHLLRAAHPPVPRVADPGSGHGGWHNDTPYQQLMQRGFPEYGFGPNDSMPPLGLQCNMCIDEYTEANGGTMFVPDSYKLGEKPQHAHIEYQENTYRPPEAQTLVAPAGSVFCYHAATWHRMHPNVTTSARLGLLQSFTPDFTVPEHAKVWAADATSDELDARARLAGWLDEQVSPEMLRSYEWLAAGSVDETLTNREAHDVASLWVGEEGEGAERSTTKTMMEDSARSIDEFGRVQPQQQQARSKL